MTQRLDVMALDKNMPYPEVLDQIRESGFSRIPVYEESFDKIVGLLYIKDLLPYIEASSEFDWNHLLRKPFYVPESKKIDDLLQEFRNKRIHMAIVVDEFGGTSGLITLGCDRRSWVISPMNSTMTRSCTAGWMIIPTPLKARRL